VETSEPGESTRFGKVTLILPNSHKMATGISCRRTVRLLLICVADEGRATPIRRHNNLKEYSCTETHTKRDG